MFWAPLGCCSQAASIRTPSAPNCWTYGSPLEGAYSGRKVGLALLLLAAGTDPVRAFIGHPPTTTEILSQGGPTRPRLGGPSRGAAL